MGIRDTVDGLIRNAGAVPPPDRSKTTLTDGSPVTPDHRKTRPNGMQSGYVVLSDEERARGFVRPVRVSYVHVGKPPPSNLRDLTPEERSRYADYGYVKFEPYPDKQSPVVGRFWTQPELDRITRACNTTTRMGTAIAETYARDPKFYGATYCCGCGAHFPVDEFVWDGTSERVGS